MVFIQFLIIEWGVVGSLNWLFRILLPLHKTLIEEEMVVIGVLGFQIVEILLGHSVGLRTTVLTLTWLNSTMQGRNPYIM